MSLSLRTRYGEVLGGCPRTSISSAYIRLMVFYGSEGMGLRATGLKVHVIVAAWEWGAYLGDEALEQGIKVRASSYTRHHRKHLNDAGKKLTVIIFTPCWIAICQLTCRIFLT